MPLLGWSTRCSTSGRSTASERVFDEDLFWPALQLSLKLAVGDGADHAGAARADRALRASAPAARAAARRVPHRAPLRGSADRAGRRCRRLLPRQRPLVLQLAMGAGAVLRRSWRCRSRIARSTPGIKAIDVRTLVDASRSLGAGWVDDLPPRARAEPGVEHPVGLVPDHHRSCSASSRSPSRSTSRRFPVFSFQYFGRNPQGGIALALLTLLVTTLAARCCSLC